MGFEKPYQPTPEEQAKIKKERTLSDAELIKEGSGYALEEDRLELTKEQIEKIKKEMNVDIAQKYENLKDIIKNKDNEIADLKAQIEALMKDKISLEKIRETIQKQETKSLYLSERAREEKTDEEILELENYAKKYFENLWNKYLEEIKDSRVAAPLSKEEFIERLKITYNIQNVNEEKLNLHINNGGKAELLCNENIKELLEPGDSITEQVFLDKFSDDVTKAINKAVEICGKERDEQIIVVENKTYLVNLPMKTRASIMFGVNPKESTIHQRD